MKKIGLIINPIAGMGGSVGLKGTDHVAEEAIRRGAVPRAGERAEKALEELLTQKDKVEIYTCPGRMGGDLSHRLGFHTVFPERESPGVDLKRGDSLESPAERMPTALTRPETDRENALLDTGSGDTVKLVKWFLQEQVDLILFAGGDGTARDIYSAAELSVPCVGIPAGVKIHSPVYAKNPRAAGRLAALWIEGKVTATEEEEVLDIDEEQYRKEIISTRLYGYLRVPKERSLIQSRKAPTPLSDEASIESIACEVTDGMEPDTFYLIGAGTTTRGVMLELGLPCTLIGVDLIYNKKIVANDLTGQDILPFIKGRKVKLIVTITGGQGFLFGRGNQQLTPEVIQEIGRENIIILATKAKLASLGGRPLLVDTYDEELNRSLCGYYRTVTGFGEFTICKVSDC